MNKHFVTSSLTIILFVAHQICTAQQVSYAKEVINTLCSESMKGRGYVDHGDKNAANYLASEFEKSGLKKYSKSYFQTFTTPVNSFPGKMSLSVNGNKLKPGEDFLIDPGSPGISGKFSAEVLTPEDLLSKDGWIKKIKSASSRFVVVSAIDKTQYNADQLKRINEVVSFLKYNKDNPAKGVLILTDEKLTWSGSTELFFKPCFTIKASALI